jgi:hypothetical protein
MMGLEMPVGKDSEAAGSRKAAVACQMEKDCVFGLAILMESYT